MTHKEVRLLLYEYCTGTLSRADRNSVDSHLADCTACADEMKEIRAVLSIIPVPEDHPEAERDEIFWNQLVENVEEEIGSRRIPSLQAFLSRTGERIRTLLTYRPAVGYSLAGAVALLLVVFLFRLQTDTGSMQAERIAPQPDSAYVLAHENTAERIGEYFRKSRTLLIGLANLNPAEQQGIDLSAERKLSRNLVREARYLKQQPLDGRSVRLVQDLEKILIELANLEESTDLPGVELIRSGIRQENLLFKIRMAEASLDTTSTSESDRVY